MGHRRRFIVTQGGIRWLLRAEFGVDKAAPILPYVEGGSTLTGTDSANVLTVSGGRLVVANTTGVNDPRVFGPVLDRLIGRAAILEYTPSGATQRWMAGWNANTTTVPNQSVYIGPSLAFSVLDNGVALAVGGIAILVDGTSYQFAVVLRSTGELIFVKGGVFTAWTLAFVTTANTAASLYAGVGASAATANGGSMDFIGVRDFGGLFEGAKTLDVAAPVSGTLYAGTAEHTTLLTVTAPNPLANTCELRYRVQDDNNYWTCYFDSSGNFKVDTVAAGSATNRVTVASAIAAGETRIIQARTRGSLNTVFTKATTTWSRRYQASVSHMDTAVGVKPVAGVGWVLGPLLSFPSTSTAYDVLSVGIP